jgi:Mn2+/Fe2+ NRAMP family transporter
MDGFLRKKIPCYQRRLITRMTSNPVYMKAHANSLSVKLLAWVLFALITGANFVLLGSLAG